MKISYPQNGDKIYKTFLAVGRIELNDEEFTKVSGKLTELNGSNAVAWKEYNGLVVRSPSCEKRGDDHNAYRRWAILFTGIHKPTAGNKFLLEIHASFMNDGQRVTEKIDNLEFKERLYSAPSIDYPATNETGVPRLFVAYGTRPDSPVSAAQMQLGGNPAIPADFIFDDPETMFWAAEFSIPSEDVASGYTLTVTTDVPATSTGIEIVELS